MHLTKQEHIALLSDKVRDTTFIDAKGTSKDAALLGPPSVEFAPYGRVPNSRPRKDARQSTIDQDQEFKDFLESLTNPIQRSISVDQENDAGAKSKEKVTVTPLVQFLKDKKANKGKENATPARASKHARQDSKDGKATATLENKSTGSTATPPSPKKRSAQAVKVEQAARDAVKVLNKQAASTVKGTASPSQSAAAAVTTPPTVAPNSTANAALADKKRERGNASAAAKILQRDLGLGGNAGGRGGRRGTPGAAARSAANTASAAAKGTSGSPQPVVATNTNTSTNPSVGAASTPTAANVNSTKSPAIPPTGPAAARAPPKAPASSTPMTNPVNAASATSKPTQTPSTATQAFLKHANPSQGITEPLLEEAFAGFGTINKVEIDKKKGFAYIDFAEPESLQKAIKASPIKVAQGQVVVLERKTGPTLQARNSRGGGPMMGNRGGGMPMGGRGGSMRGRGGFGRGSAHTHHMNNVKSTPAAVNTIADAAPTKSATLDSDTKSAENSASQTAINASTTSMAGAGSETQVG